MINKNLTIENTRELKDLFLSRLSDRPSPPLDLSGISRIDLAGLQLLVGLIKEAAFRGQEIHFTGPLSPEFREELSTCGLFIDIPDRGEALEIGLKELIESNERTSCTTNN